MKATFPITVLYNPQTQNLIISIEDPYIKTAVLPRIQHLTLYDLLKDRMVELYEASLKQIDVTSFTKGQIMEIVYNAAGTNTRGVDSAIPQSIADDLGNLTFWHVYDYQKNAFGELIDLREKAKENGILLIYNK